MAGLYASVMIVCLCLLARKGDWSERGWFDVISDVGGFQGGTNHQMFIVVGIPLTVTLLIRIFDHLEQPIYAIHLGSRFRIFNIHVLSAVGLSLLFTLFVVAFSSLTAGLLWMGKWLEIIFREH